MKKLTKLRYMIEYYDLKYPYLKFVPLLIIILVMLMGTKSISVMLIRVVVFTIAVMLHEISHGVVAYMFGDDTAKNAGRLTLNPVKHMDLEGLLLPAMLIIFRSPIIIGSAKPVPVSYYKLKNKKIAVPLVSLAGIVMNLILAYVSYLLLPILGVYSSYLAMFLINMVTINISLAAFNIIPIPPLDGSRILRMIIPYEWRGYFDMIENNPMLSLLIIIIILESGILNVVYRFLIGLIIR